MEEIWKKVEGFNDLYFVSNFGNVYSKYTGKNLKPFINKNGYSTFILRKNNKNITIQAHRLVAQAFLPNPNNLPIVCHKVAISNGGTNHVDNLYWGTTQDNADDRTRDGNHAKAVKEKICKSVIQMDLDGNFIQEYNSLTEAAKVVNGNVGNICKACKGIKKSYKGFKWTYKVVKC